MTSTPRVITPNTHLSDTRDRILLSFDGGGIRGYWNLLTLQHLMQVIRNLELAQDESIRSGFRPCEMPDNFSHLNDHAEFTPFLLFHYFDYMGGTSTGTHTYSTLITILLCRFHMTVEDCLKEVFHKMNIFMRQNNYDRKNLEMAVREVIERRVQVRIKDDTEPLLQDEIDTCRGVVLAMSLARLTRPENIRRFMFRSYIPYSEKRRVNAQSALDSKNSILRNPGEGMRTPLLKVALAGTAAPFYFGHYHTVLSIAQAQAANCHLLEGKSSHRVENAGFSTDNNPCWELRREIQYHHGDIIKTITVSIGTARPKYQLRAWKPEDVHEKLREERQLSYYRLRDEGEIEIEMDEWKPKRDGSNMIAQIETGFVRCLRQDGVEDTFKQCASNLVQMRRDRMQTSRWGQFALGQYFACQVQHCPKDLDNRSLDRADFENHLKHEHVEQDYEDLSTSLEICRRVWKCRQRAAPS
ncbi:acyl transferase/acyl hydrolase/lysophospholipase [Xylaria scruposa]|nr:acyl transferase/acyl hydrolase/lysophospholipase [Xylaria scruposa]